MRDKRSDNESIVGELVGRSQLEEAARRAAVEPAQSGSASAAPSLGLIVENESYNRYTVQLAVAGSAGQSPQPIQGEQVSAVNLAEPFDEAGQLQADTVVMVWPSQGLYLFGRSVESEDDSADYWAKVISGSGPSYTVRRQVATGADTFADAAGASDVAAANTWELTVDSGATADVPAGAIVRVWEEPDTGQTPRRFFFYPIHAVYR